MLGCWILDPGKLYEMVEGGVEYSINNTEFYLALEEIDKRQAYLR